jgi:hypothetical protein
MPYDNALSLMKELPIINNGFAIVDDDVYERAKDFKWYLSSNGHPAWNGKGRARIGQCQLHQFVLGRAPKPLVTDHINGNKLDNRRENLRFVTQRVNCLNTSKRTRVSRDGPV